MLVALALAGGACAREERAPVLPDAGEVAAWYGEGTEAELDGAVLEVRGTIEPDFLRRGGRIWARSGPFFYLFTVRTRDLFEEYPDLVAVRAIARTRRGEEVARAILHRSELSEVQWRTALARASLAQTQGTANPRRIEELIEFGEDHTEFRYASEGD